MIDCMILSLLCSCNCAYLPTPLENFFQGQLIPTLIQRLHDVKQLRGEDATTYLGLHTELRGLLEKIKNSRLSGAGEDPVANRRPSKPKSGPVIEHASPARERPLEIGPRADLLNQLVDSIMAKT